MGRRVAITGLGAVTSLGMGAEQFWSSIKNGKCGISTIERIDVSDLPTKVGAEIKDFHPADYIEKKEIKRMDRYAQYAMAAAQMAVESSKLNIDHINKERLGVIIGSGVGGIETMENQHRVLLEKGSDRISAFFVPMMIANMASGVVAIKYGAKGYNECIVTACASSANSIGEAFKVIQRNAADIMITGGAEAPITKLAFAGFCAKMKTLPMPVNPLTSKEMALSWEKAPAFLFSKNLNMHYTGGLILLPKSWAMGVRMMHIISLHPLKAERVAPDA